jgi:hypothetical protein
LAVPATAATDIAGNASAASSQFLASILYGTAGSDTLTVGPSLDHIFLGAGADVLKITSAANSTVALPDDVMDFAAGDKIDFSVLLGTGGSGSGYTGSALNDSGTGFVELKNLLLTSNAITGKTTVTFDVTFDSASVAGSKISGAVIDLAYDAALVNKGTTLTKVTSATFSYIDELGDTVISPVWVDTLSQSFNITTGKFAALATQDSGNLVNPIVSADGKVFSVRIIVDQIVSKFQVGLDSGTTWVDTADGKTHIVDVGITKTAGINIGSNGVLEIITDVTTLGTVGDNQLHMVSNYDAQQNITHLQVQYDTNSTFGTTTASSVIAFDFDGNVTANLTPASLTFI